MSDPRQPGEEPTRGRAHEDAHAALVAAREELTAARAQRAELAAQLRRAERELRAARQGEHAETARRTELEEDAAATHAAAEHELAVLRSALAERDERVRVLREELSQALRTAAATGLRAPGTVGAPPPPALLEEHERATAEVTLLSHELDRRVRINAALARRLVDARMELAAREERVLQATGELGEAERALGDLRGALRERAATLRSQADELVAARSGREDALAAAAAAEAREQEAAGRLAAERHARAEAETGRQDAERRLAELGRTAGQEREAAEVQAAATGEALVALHRELVRARAEAEEQRTRAAELAVLIEALTAGAEAPRRDRAEDGAPDGRFATERAARLAAETALEDERRRGRAREQSVVELEDELEKARTVPRPAPPMPAADHPALAPPAGTDDGSESAREGAGSVIIDLARAAARLRTRREGDAVLEHPVEAEDVVEFAPYAPAGRPAPRAWLTPALAAFARRDPAAGAAVIAALLPVQADRLTRPLTYDVCFATGHEFRVRLDGGGAADVAPLTEADAAGDGSTPAFRIAGAPAALAVFAGGGTGRRAPALVAVTGRARAARRLRRALREPVGLEAIARAGVTLPPPVLLELIASAVPQEHLQGAPVAVTFAEDDGPVLARLVLDQGALAARGAGPDPADASIRVAAGTLVAFLAGQAGARMSGDPEAVARLLGWIDALEGARG